MVDLVDRLNVLLKQDKVDYACEDYLDPAFQERLVKESDLAPPAPPLVSSASTISSSSSSLYSGINESWREKICEWSYQVVDHFDMSREVVQISISFLDRYLSVRAVDKKLFQLAAMTTLYLAIKLYERGTLSMASMIDLSRGYFMVDQMAAMEMSIFQALSWRVHPPTPFCLARHLLHLIPVSPSFPMALRHELLEHARFLTELSVIDYFFVSKHSSSVALAALLNSMDNCGSFPLATRIEFLKQLSLLDNLDPNEAEIEECRFRLHELYVQGGYAVGKEGEEPLRTDTVSPTCVATAFNNAQPPKQTIPHDNFSDGYSGAVI